MSEVESHKRKREDEEDEYEPSEARVELPELSGREGAGASRERIEHNEEHGGHKRQRRAFLPKIIELAKRITVDISCLGDNPQYLTKDLDSISLPISKELEVADEFRNAILEFFYGMAIEQPHKVHCLSGLIQLCNVKNPKVGQYIIEYLHSKVQEILDGLSDEESVEKNEQDEANMIIYGSSECGPWDRLKLMLRFLASLSPILEDYSVVTIFKTFLETSINLQEEIGGETRSALSEMIFFSIISSIPYIIASDRDNEELKTRCNELLKIGENFKYYQLKSTPEFLQHFTISNPETQSLPYEPKQMVSLILPAVKKLSEDGWNVDLFFDIQTIIEPYIKAELEKMESNKNQEMKSEEGNEGENKEEDTEVEPEKKESEEKPKAQVPKHSLPQFKMPKMEIIKKHSGLDKSVGNIDSLWRTPRIILQVFNPSSIGFDTVPPVESYISLLLRDLTQDLVQNMEYNRIIVSKQLLILHLFFNKKLFAQPNSSIDKLSLINDLNNGVDLIDNLENNDEIPPEAKAQMIESTRAVQRELEEGYTSTWKMEKIITDSILNLMFSLPKSSNPLIYYQSLLADTCYRDLSFLRRHGNNTGVDKVSFAKVIGGAIRFFFKNATILDFELRIRFINWFVYQVSNFGFDWQWVEWITDAEKLHASNYHPTIFIIKNLIASEIRISTPSNIKSTLPNEFHRFINLALYGKEKLKLFDRQFFGELVDTTIDYNSYNEGDEEGKNVDAIPEDAGNAEIFSLIDQFHFNNQEHPFHEICNSIYSNIQENESLQEFNDLILKLKEEVSKDEKNTVKIFSKYLVTLVVQSICIIGSRSLSVIEGGALEICGDKLRKVIGLSVIDKETNEEVLLENDQFQVLTGDEEKLNQRQSWVIEAVLRLWVNESRIGYLILEKMKNKGFISSIQLVKSLYIDEENILPITNVYAFELLERLINDGDDKSVLRISITKIIDNINIFTEKIDTGDDESQLILTPNDESEVNQETELKWGFNSLLSLLKFQIKNYLNDLNEINALEIFSNIEHQATREYIKDSFNDYLNDCKK
ncbi:hypothetical protein B5S27_g1014 [[Candida] boidinii]|nr:hypothetical protein B5S27_g1014 [[Candida] boidinii]